jgi:hypothetical protein
MNISLHKEGGVYMELKNIRSLDELEKILLKELKDKGFHGEDSSIYDIFSREDTRIIESLTREFNVREKFVEQMGNKVIGWYKLEHEIPENTVPYWVFMDYIATKAAVSPSMTLQKYTMEYLKERYEYVENYQMY